MALRVTLAGQIGVGVGQAAAAATGLGRPGRLGLAYLVWARQRPVPRDELAEVLWGEELPASWEQMLRGVVFKIRGLLASVGLDPAAALTSAGGAYQLHLPADAVVDVEEAAADLAGATASLEAGYPGAAQARAAEAVAVAARHFAPGASGTWAEARQAELAELHLGALEVLGRAAVAQGDWAAAVAAAEQVLSRQEFRETAYVILMDAHAGAGRRGEALRAYERCRQVLVEALGVNPSPPTEAAYLRLLGEDPAPVAAPAALPLPPALAPGPGAFVVGREAEAERLAAALKRATAEGRQAVVVAGEAGAGKTTLVAAAARAAHDAGARVLYGRCDEALGVAYQPFAQALGHYVATAPEAELAAHVAAWGGELSRLVPELARRLPAATPPPPTDADADRWPLFEAAADLIARAGALAPVVVVLDDLHWAAAPTLLLLRHLLADTRPGAVLILATYRDSDVGPDHPLVATLADLRRITTVERLNLGGLDADGVAAFVAATGVDDDGLARAVHAHTAGNPFFVGQLLAHLAETAATYRRHGPWSYYAEGAGLGVPEGVGEVVARRLGRLSAAANRALVLAAVAGADFDLEVIDRAGDDDDDATALDAIEEAVAARLVVEGRPGSYSFVHALVRDALYGNLGGMRRVRLHRRVGEAIESLPGDDPARLVALAHHFAKAAPAGCATKAADYALAAGNAAVAQYAPEQAVSLLDRGLETLDSAGVDDPRRRAELWLSVAKARTVVFDPTAHEAFVSAARAAKAAGDIELLAEAAAWSCSRGGRPDGLALVEDALDFVGEDRLTARARLLVALATGRAARGEDALQMSADGVALAKASEDPDVVAYALGHHACLLMGGPRVEGFLEMSREWVACGSEGDGGHVNWAVNASRFRAQGLLVTGDRTGFEADMEVIERWARERGDPPARRTSWVWRLTRSLMDGRFGDADDLLDRGIDGDTDKPENRAMFASQRAQLHWAQGRLGEVDGLLAEDVRRHPNMPILRPLLALAHLARGETTTARREQAELLASLDRSPYWHRSHMLAHLAELSHGLHDAESATHLYQRLQPYAGHLLLSHAEWFLGAADHYLGMLATLTADWERADAHFRQAIALESAVSPPMAVRTRRWFVEMLAARPGRGRYEAAALARVALVTAEQLGMDMLRRDLRSLLETIESPGGRAQAQDRVTAP